MSYLKSFDKNMKHIGVLVDADRIARKRRLNSDYELSFLVPMNSEDYTEKIVLKGHVMDEKGQYYVVNSRKRDRSDRNRMAVISCMHVMFKLTDFKFPYSDYIDEGFGVDISTLTDLISNATGGKFTFSIDSLFPLKDVKDFGRGNCMEALNAIVKLYECEVTPNNFKIHLREKIGNPNSDMQYRLQKNIISDSFTDDVRALTTRMFSQMKDGLTFIGLSASHLTSEEYDLLNDVGGIADGKIAVNYLISPYAASWANDTNTYFDNEVINQDIEDQLELLEFTRKSLRENEVPQLDINIKSADLHKIDNTEPKPELGDYVKCIDPGMEMNSIDARIIELTEYPYDHTRHADVSLANFMKKDYDDIIADLDASKRIVDDLISGGRVRTSAFESFARQAVIDINNSKSQVIYDPRGIVLESKITSGHEMILTSEGLVISTDGGATANTAVTAEGVAAAYIVGILGEFAEVKTDNLIAGDALIGSALIESLKVEKLDASTAKITSAMIEKINADQINVGTLTGFRIQTQLPGNYPRIELNSTLNIFSAQSTSNSEIDIDVTTGGSPALNFNHGNVSGGVWPTLNSLLLYTVTGFGDIEITSGGHLILSAAQNVNVQSWSKLVSSGAGKSLQIELNEINSSINSINNTLNARVRSLSGQDISMQIFSNNLEVFLGGSLVGVIPL